MADLSIIGAGSWGTATAICQANNGHNVQLWAYLPEECERLKQDNENKAFLPGVEIPRSVTFTNTLADCGDADLIILATPSHTIRQTAKNLAPYVRDGQKIISISKGFDEDRLLRLSQVIRNEIPNALVAAMSGPSHAEEVAREMPTTNVVAHEDLAVAQMIQACLVSDRFRLYANSDIIGVELGGALKNVIALAAGICDGLGFGDNTKAALMTRGMAEIVRLGVAMGARPETFSGLSGIGDLIVTCTSMHSRNRRAGILIGQGKTVQEAQDEVKMVVEGVKATRAAYALAQKFNVEMPIVQEAYRVLFEGKPVSDCINNLMGRAVKDEIEHF